ncbi:hypothetical protein Bca101_007368 [Brassica carinata]
MITTVSRLLEGLWLTAYVEKAATRARNFADVRSHYEADEERGRDRAEEERTCHGAEKRNRDVTRGEALEEMRQRVGCRRRCHGLHELLRKVVGLSAKKNDELDTEEDIRDDERDESERDCEFS